MGNIAVGAVIRKTTPLTMPEGYRPVGVVGVASNKYETTINRATMSGYTLDLIMGNSSSGTIVSAIATATVLCVHT